VCTTTTTSTSSTNDSIRASRPRSASNTSRTLVLVYTTKSVGQEGPFVGSAGVYIFDIYIYIYIYLYRYMLVLHVSYSVF
jgi:hypothetical protein